VYSDATEKKVRRMIMKYRIDGGEEQMVEDLGYPFEFSIPLPDLSTTLQARVVGEDTGGNVFEESLPILSRSSGPEASAPAVGPSR
jgi:hypothetical protein